jgi:hypothetical protein
VEVDAFHPFVFLVVETVPSCGMMMSIQLQEGIMELSLRLDTLGMVELRYLRGSSFLPLLPFLPPLPTLFLSMPPHKKSGTDSHSDRR